jgi:hypothetical protein
MSEPNILNFIPQWGIKLITNRGIAWYRFFMILVGTMPTSSDSDDTRSLVICIDTLYLFNATMIDKFLL